MKDKLSDDVEIFLEPVESWRYLRWNGRSFNPLKEFYVDKSLFPLQIYIQSTFARNLFSVYNKAKRDGKKVLITERRLCSSVDFFSALGLRMGALTEKDYAMIDYNMESYKNMLPQLFSYDAIFYLSCDPSVCIKRIKERGREEEQNISLKYLWELDQIYNNWFNNDNRVATKLDANKNIEWLIQHLSKSILEFYH